LGLRTIIEQDLFRYNIRKFTFGVFLRCFYLEVIPGIKFTIIFRACQYYRRKNRLLFYFYFWWLKRLKYKYGFDISYRTTIGKGLYIGHFGGVVIHGDTIIGENCNLSQGITIGVLIRGGKSGIPTIGDRVFIAPGAVILGGIKIGNDVLIGSNAIVNFDVPDNAVVASPLASVISQKGSSDYVTRTV
jgi:serine O-acetyltransferase